MLQRAYKAETPTVTVTEAGPGTEWHRAVTVSLAAWPEQPEHTTYGDAPGISDRLPVTIFNVQRPSGSPIEVI